MNVVTLKDTRILDVIGNTLLQVFPSVYIVRVSNGLNYFLYATKKKTTLNEVKTAILNKIESISSIQTISRDDKLTIQVLFSYISTKLQEVHSTNDIYFTDDHCPIEHVVGLYP